MDRRLYDDQSLRLDRTERDRGRGATGTRVMTYQDEFAVTLTLATPARDQVKLEESVVRSPTIPRFALLSRGSSLPPGFNRVRAGKVAMFIRSPWCVRIAPEARTLVEKS
jgi:hypothetical protein